MCKPTTAHWVAVKRILWHFKATPDHGMVYRPSHLLLIACADADYVRDPDDRCSR